MFHSQKPPSLVFSLSVLVLGLFSLNACSIRLNHRNYSVIMNENINGVSYYRESLDDGLMGVAICKDGEIFGLENLPADFELPHRFCKDDYVSHPKIPQWQDSMLLCQVQINAITESSDELENVNHDELLHNIQELPFTAVRRSFILDYSKSYPEANAAILEKSDKLDLDKKTVGMIVESALSSPHTKAQDIDRWLESENLMESECAVLHIAHHPLTTGSGQLKILRHVDDYHGTNQRLIFEACTQNLAADPDAAHAVVEQLLELHGSSQSKALDKLLREAHCIQIERELLRQLDEFYGTKKFELYKKLIYALANDASSQHSLVKNLDEMYGSKKLICAKLILDHAEPTQLICSLILRKADDFYRSQLEDLLITVINNPACLGAPMDQCIHIAEEELYGSKEKKVLEAVLLSSQSNAAQKRRADRILGK